MNIELMRRGHSTSLPHKGIQWLGFTGDQTIDTGIAGNAVYSIEFTLGVYTNKYSNQVYLASNNSNRLYSAGINGTENPQFHMFQNGTLIINGLRCFGNVQTLKAEGSTLYLGNSYSRSITMPLFNTSDKIRLALNLGGNTKPAEFHFIKLIMKDNNDNKLFDGVPVKTKSNVGCIYDYVTKAYFNDINYSYVPFECGPDLNGGGV